MKTKLSYKLIYILVSILFVLFTLGPIIWCCIIAITPESEMLKSTTSLFPSKIYWGNFKELFDPSTRSYEIVFTGIFNSLKISIFSVLICIPVSIMAAYGFSRYRFKGKYFIIKFIMITIVIPVFTTIIPLYAMFVKFRILDSIFFTSIIYVSSFIPLTTWIMLNYINAIPSEIFEASMVEGCNEREIFFYIVLPISYPIILTCILMVFIMSWNQFQIPLILLSSPENKVITMVMSEFMQRNDISYGLIAVSGLISLIIPAVMAVLFRNKLISGLTQGSVKG